jgi:uncharacterized membrane protein
MPKGKGENSKAVEAKARKAEAAKSLKDKKDKAAEDASWEDDDKNLAKKQNRKVYYSIIGVNIKGVMNIDVWF